MVVLLEYKISWYARIPANINFSSPAKDSARLTGRVGFLLFSSGMQGTCLYLCEKIEYITLKNYGYRETTMYQTQGWKGGVY